MLANFFFIVLVMSTCTVQPKENENLGYLVGNLVATNWPIEKALHAIGCN